MRGEKRCKRATQLQRNLPPKQIKFSRNPDVQTTAAAFECRFVRRRLGSRCEARKIFWRVGWKERETGKKRKKKGKELLHPSISAQHHLIQLFFCQAGSPDVSCRSRIQLCALSSITCSMLNHKVLSTLKLPDHTVHSSQFTFKPETCISHSV
jgi:hypothetical protein